jgi:dienelactone hydrolase
MTTVALFHSVLGIRPGVLDAADRLRTAGHEVTIVDYYDGRSFESYEEAGAFVEEVGFPELMAQAMEGVSDLDDGFAVMGFSNGAGMAEHVATQRPVGGAILVAGALPLEMLGVNAWPARVAAQLHATVGDPNRKQEWVDAVVSAVEAAGAPVEVFDYEGTGHLFSDPSLPDEFDPAATELLYERVLRFLG